MKKEREEREEREERDNSSLPTYKHVVPHAWQLNAMRERRFFHATKQYYAIVFRPDAIYSTYLRMCKSRAYIT